MSFENWERFLHNTIDQLNTENKRLGNKRLYGQNYSQRPETVCDLDVERISTYDTDTADVKKGR